MAEQKKPKEVYSAVPHARHLGGAPGKWTLEVVTLYTDGTWTAKPVKGVEGVERAVVVERLVQRVGVRR